VDSIASYGETLNYFYDGNGRVTDIVAQFDSAYDRVFGYDGAGRLDKAYGPWGTGSYTYDPLGNITQKKLGGRTVDIEYDALNRVDRVRDTAAGGSWRDYAHDARGNVTSDGRHGFTYDHANQPVSISDTDSGSYTYDGRLRRVKQVVGGETIYSIYGRDGALLTRDNATTGEITDYVSVGGQTFVRLKDGEPTYPLNDHLGTALLVADQSGAITSAHIYQYTPFGETWGALSPPGENDEQGYTGHVEDATGLTYMQARYFDPVMGRFLSADPVGYEDQLNVYAYVHNDSINMIDPNGEFGLLGAAVGGVFGIVSSVAVQKFTGDKEINWGTVAAAGVTGAVVGATGGLAVAAASKIGLTGLSAKAAVTLPSATVAYIGGSVTQIIENTQNNVPMEGVHSAGLTSAAGTALGGYFGNVGTSLLTRSNVMGASGSLVGGKLTAEIAVTISQEMTTQTISGLTQSENHSCIVEAGPCN